MECCSKELKAFSNRVSVKEMNEIISSWFKTNPKIKFICKIYEDHIVENNERGGTIEKLKATDTKYFEYFSSRDVSGPLIFQNEYFRYICFLPIPDIKFADKITYSDYKKEKSEFYKDSNHESGDRYYYSEERFIPGLKKEGYLINIYDSCNCFFTKCVYITFIILSFGQIYKLIIFSCIKTFPLTIRKIVSKRNDLSKDPKYIPFTPKVIFPNCNLDFNPEDISHTKKGMNIIPPTNEELTQSMKYQNYIPNYQIYYGNNRKLNGSVIDIQKYPNNLQNYNTYEQINPNYGKAINVNIKQDNYNMQNNNESNANLPINNTEGNIFGKNFNNN